MSQEMTLLFFTQWRTHNWPTHTAIMPTVGLTKQRHVGSQPELQNHSSKKYSQPRVYFNELINMPASSSADNALIIMHTDLQLWQTHNPPLRRYQRVQARHRNAAHLIQGVHILSKTRQRTNILVPHQMYLCDWLTALTSFHQIFESLNFSLLLTPLVSL